MKKFAYTLPSLFAFDVLASTFPSLRPAGEPNVWENNGTTKVLSGFFKKRDNAVCPKFHDHC